MGLEKPRLDLSSLGCALEALGRDLGQNSLFLGPLSLEYLGGKSAFPKGNLRTISNLRLQSPSPAKTGLNPEFWGFFFKEKLGIKS